MLYVPEPRVTSHVEIQVRARFVEKTSDREDDAKFFADASDLSLSPQLPSPKFLLVSIFCLLWGVAVYLHCGLFYFNVGLGWSQ